jgi:hypothetical protein
MAQVSVPDEVAETRNRLTIVMSPRPGLALAAGSMFSPRTTSPLPAPEQRTSLSTMLTCAES